MTLNENNHSNYPTEDCRNSQSWSDLQLSGETLSASQELFLQTHLHSCTVCQRYQSAMANLVASLEDLETLPAPIGLSDKVMARVESVMGKEKASRSPSFIRQFLSKPTYQLGAVAAVGLLLVLALPVFQSMTLVPSTQQEIAQSQGVAPDITLQEAEDTNHVMSQHAPDSTVQQHSETFDEMEAMAPDPQEEILAQVTGADPFSEQQEDELSAVDPIMMDLVGF